MRLSAPKNRRAVILLMMLAVMLCAGGINVIEAQAGLPPVPEEDTQEWNDVQLSVPLNKEVDFNLSGTLRLGRNVTHLIDRRVGVGFTFRAGKYLTLAPSYLNIIMRPAEGRKVRENRLNFAATLALPLGKFRLSDRNLFERRLRFPLDSTRYRNRLQLEHPFKIGKTALQLFVSDEVFYDWSVDDWVRNRFTVGGSRRFNRYFTGDLYYMRQNDGRSRPGDLHVVGTSFRFRL